MAGGLFLSRNYSTEQDTYKINNTTLSIAARAWISVVITCNWRSVYSRLPYHNLAQTKRIVLITTPMEFVL